MNNAVILAGGQGKRMKADIPKPMFKVLGEPMLEWVIKACEGADITELCIVTGFMSEVIDEYLNGRYESVIQSERLGTGHAVMQAVPFMKRSSGGNTLVLCGDAPFIDSKTIGNALKLHESEGNSVTVITAEIENPKGYGRIVRSGDGISCIVEEKDANPQQREIREVNSGAYSFKTDDLLEYLGELTQNNSQGEYYLTDIISWCKKNGLNVNAYILENSDEIYGINSRHNLAEAAKIMNDRKLYSLMENGVTIVDPSSTWISEDTEIGADTIVYPATYIEGKNKIGQNCKIGPCAHLRGGVEVADNCKIGNFVEVKKAKIDHNTNVGHLSYIGDSELGANVNIGAGTITANYNPLTKVKSKTVLKDDVKIGSNTVLVAPVTINEGANVGAGSVITKEVPSWALALTRTPLKILADWVKSQSK